MADAADLQDDALWRGGFYELAIELGERDDARLGDALAAVWQAAGAERCLGRSGHEPPTYDDVACTLDELRRYGRLAGIVNLPKSRRVICGARTVRENSGTDWLVFFIPVGALELAEPRSAAFPFRGGDSLLWRRPLDKWLAGVGRRVYETVPYQLGLIGLEVAGLTTAGLLHGTPPAERWVGYLIPDAGELAYHQADR